jgi:hypothetical protein
VEKAEVLTLRIKKKYLDEIVQGTKKSEYRKVSGFYDKLLFLRPYKYLKLHYQTPEKVLVELLSIAKIKSPFKNIGMGLDEEWVYELKLGKVISHERDK